MTWELSERGTSFPYLLDDVVIITTFSAREWASLRTVLMLL